MALIGPERTKELAGTEVLNPADIKDGEDLIVCQASKCYQGTARLWTFNKYVLIGEYVPIPYLQIILRYDEPDAGTSLQDTYIKHFTIRLYPTEDGSFTIDPLPFRIFRVAYGSGIANVAHAKNLSPDTANTIAHMLTGRRPKSELPARITKKQFKSMEEKSDLPSDTSQMYKALGGRTRRVKGKKYRKRAGRPSTHRTRSSSH